MKTIFLIASLVSGKINNYLKSSSIFNPKDIAIEFGGSNLKILKMMSFIWLIFIVCVSIPTDAPPATTSRPKCEGFTCPNNDPEGGLFPYDKDGCGPQFCDCSYGKHKAILHVDN